MGVNLGPKNTCQGGRVGWGGEVERALVVGEGCNVSWRGNTRANDR